MIEISVEGKHTLLSRFLQSQLKGWHSLIQEPKNPRTQGFSCKSWKKDYSGDEAGAKRERRKMAPTEKVTCRYRAIKTLQDFSVSVTHTWNVHLNDSKSSACPGVISPRDHIYKCSKSFRYRLALRVLKRLFKPLEEILYLGKESLGHLSCSCYHNWSIGFSHWFYQ